MIGRVADRLLAAAVRGAEAARRRAAARPGSAVRARLRALEDQVGPIGPFLERGGTRGAWLVHATVRAELPVRHEVEATARDVAEEGAEAALARVVGLPRSRRVVRLLQDAVLVDVEHTCRTELATGIQRVARLTTRAWAASHDVTLVRWTDDHRALRVLRAEAAARLLGRPVAPGEAGADEEAVVVPLGGTYLLPELAVERRRTDRIGALAACSGLRTGAIGFDCVPVTSAETTAPGMGGAFAGWLSAVREIDVLAAISRSAASEFDGWVQMVRESGLPGPQVVAVPLPVVPLDGPPAGEDEVRRHLAAGDEPLVLCVGSHEPRKNHLALLHAAELAWREGTRFRLVLVGGNAWRSEAFEERVAELVEDGRPLTSLRALDDRLLAGAYRAARAVVFPSLTEGFGLPVAEALAVGTPVLTAGYGSTAEVATAGALLVDPRDDTALHEALRRLLLDDDLRDRLVAESAALPHGSWQAYADALWRVLPTP